jgi:nucleoside-diphosphate-sugar epimerase
MAAATMKRTNSDLALDDAFTFPLFSRSKYNKNRRNLKVVCVRMRIFITGISGFLGGHLAETLVQRDHHVVGLARQTSRCAFVKSLGVELVQMTLEDVGGLARVMNRADVVIHAAAKVPAHGFWSDFVQSNINGTRHVLQAAIEANVPRFIHMSTVGIYGFPRPDRRPFDESCDYGAVHRWNYYSRSKIEAEKLARASQNSGRIQVTILRPTWVYGPRDPITLDRLVPVLRSGRVKWIGNTRNRMSVLYVSDAVEAIALAATKSQAAGQIYNIAADELSPTQHEYFTTICELLGLPLPQDTIPYRLAYAIGFASEWIAHLTAYHVRPPLSRLAVLVQGGERRFSGTKVRQELGWQPKISFGEGMQRTIAWYRSRVPEPA